MPRPNTPDLDTINITRMINRRQPNAPTHNTHVGARPSFEQERRSHVPTKAARPKGEGQDGARVYLARVANPGHD